MRPIGGEFELYADSLALESHDGPLHGFGAAHEYWVDCGRSALGLIADALSRLPRVPTVWLPAYCCESVVEPFATRTLPIRFYGVGNRLDDVQADPLPGDALLFIHYFGRLNRVALSRVDDLRRRGVHLIEDCVQAALTQGVGVSGDQSLTSLRKLLPQPDGALLASRRPLRVNLDMPNEAFVSARSVGKLLRGAGADAGAFLPLFDASELALDSRRPRAMSWLSSSMLRATDLHDVARRRVRNEIVLRQLLEEKAGALPISLRFVQPPLEDGEVPLGLPMEVDHGQRDMLRRHLARHSIFCPVHWDLGHLDAHTFTTERNLSARLLTLPVDQRYDGADMRRIVEAISNFSGDRS